MNELEPQQFESIVEQLCDLFEVHAPPVPIETMLQEPLPGLWEEVDIRNLSGSFLSFKPGERFSPRMSIARLLVRHMCESSWGTQHGLGKNCGDKAYILSLTHVLLMPKSMIDDLPGSSRNPKAIAMHFEVPEEDARQRLLTLAEYD